jgi:hypothetical protein
MQITITASVPCQRCLQEYKWWSKEILEQQGIMPSFFLCKPDVAPKVAQNVHKQKVRGG